MAYSLLTSNNRENPRVPPFVQLALCTLEFWSSKLAIILRMSSQIRIVAYFSNLKRCPVSLVSGMGLGHPQRCYLPLAIRLLATWFTGAGIPNQLSSLLKRSKDSAEALGSNLIGAVLGGVLEYSSMVLGLKAMALVALCFYLASYLVGFRWAPCLKSPILER